MKILKIQAKIRLFFLKHRKYALIVCALLIGSMGQGVKAESRHSHEISGSLGMSNISFAEVDSKVQGSGSQAGAQSGSVSVLSLGLRYKFLIKDRLDYFIRMSAPFLSTTGDTYFAAFVGGNYYFGGQGSRIELSEEGSSLKVKPKMRYFVGLELGLSYLVFSNKVVRRSDTLFNIGGHGGASYTFSENWAATGSLHFARGTGTRTSTTAIQFFAGVTYFIGR